MPDQKKPTTPTRLDKPVLRLPKTKANSQTRANSKADVKVNAKANKKARPKTKDGALDRKQNRPDAKKPLPTNLKSRQIIYDILS